MRIVSEAPVKEKKVLVRVDFNVSIGEVGNVIDDFRIRSALPTINFLREQGAKVILLAHFGRPLDKKNSGNDVRKEFSLKPVGQHLEKLLGVKVAFSADCVGEAAKKTIAEMQFGRVALLENVRFYKGEEENDPVFAKELAGLGDIYVNDAFAVSHRAHASVEAVTKFLPSFAGFLLNKEVENLTRVRENPDHPLAIIIGGAKISTKIKLIQSFLGKAENIILGGALANTVLQAKGIAIGRSLTEEGMADQVKNLEITNTKIHLPVDGILCHDNKARSECRTGPIGKTESDEFILDIGPESRVLFDRIIKSSKMVIWNGPMGYFEAEKTCQGTLAIAKSVAEAGAYSILGGGETVALIEEKGLVDKFSFVSTGGGAMMEFLAGDRLPGLEVL